MTDVVVVGAGLAGLACALHLSRAGVEVALHEAGSVPGGRVATDVVDGMLLDHGFQVHNTAYPEVPRVLDQGLLDLRPFVSGALVRVGDRLHRVAHPLRQPSWALSSLRAPVAPLPDKVRLGLMSAADALLPADRLLARPETTALEALRRRGFSPATVDRFFRPFLSGVFLEDRLDTSSRFLDLVWRSFVLGRQAVPAAGMRAIPAQLAQRLPPGVLHLDSPVHELPRARAVVVAAGPRGAAALLGQEPPPVRSVVTHYHLAPEPPVREAAIVLDGEGGGPVANTVVLTNAAPEYAPGRHLVSSSVVRGDAAETAVRAHLERLYGVGTRDWEPVARYDVEVGLPDARPPLGRLRRPVRLGEGRYACGDHLDSPSIQGALVSGRRAATAVLQDLRVSPVAG